MLLQVRDELHVRKEEHESFARYSGLALEQIEVLNAFDWPDFPVNVVDGYDAIFVGGGSEASVLEAESYPFVKSAKALLMYCIEKEIPVFASCFGFQLAVCALDGEIIRDKDDFEMGTVAITLAPAASEDPLFRGVSNGFHGVSVHKERALDPPPGSQLLAYTEACCHAFRVPGKPFWAFQFHPEVDKRILVERLRVYQDQYVDGEDHFQAVIDSAEETPESNGLVGTFVEYVLANGAV
jgi:GMP synthase (glutamine-hydrolysing)